MAVPLRKIIRKKVAKRFVVTEKVSIFAPAIERDCL